MTDEALRALQAQVDSLERTVIAIKAALAAEAASRAARPVQAPVQAPVAPAPAPAPVAPAPAPAPVQPVPTAPAPAPATVAPAPAPAQPRPPLIARLPGQGQFEVSAGVWFSRIGTVVLLLATLYGFAWGVESGLIGPAARVALGYVAALASGAIGWRTSQRGLRPWALGVTGLGVGLSYASTFAAYRWYGLFGYPAAMSLMVLVSAAAVWLSIHYDALVIAWLGALGAYLAPFLLYRSAGSVAGLMTYVTLVDLSILAIAIWRRWLSLTVLGLAASWLIWAVSYVSAHGSWGVHFLSATVFFLIFTLAALVSEVRQRRQATQTSLSVVIAGGLIYLAAGLLTLNTPVREPYQGLFAALLALFYFAIAYGMRRLDPVHRLVGAVLTGLGVLYLSVAIPLQFHGPWISVLWAVEGTLLVWIGLSRHVPLLYVQGLMALALSAAQVGDEPRTLWFVVPLAGLWVASAAFQRFSVGSRERTRIAAILAGGATLLFLFWTDGLADWWARGAQHALPHDQVKTQAGWLLTTVWGGYGLLLMAVGLFGRSRSLRLAGVGVLGFTLLKVATVDLWRLESGWRVLGLFVLGVILLAASYLILRFKERLLARDDEG